MKKTFLFVLALLVLPTLSFVVWRGMGIRCVQAPSTTASRCAVPRETPSSDGVLKLEKEEKDRVNLCALAPSSAPVPVPLFGRSEPKTTEIFSVKAPTNDSKDPESKTAPEPLVENLTIEKPPSIASVSKAALVSSPESKPAKEPDQFVPIAVLDAERLLENPPLRPIQSSDLYDGKGTFKKDNERLRFDCHNDYVALMDNLSLGGGDNITMSFEVEFDGAAKADIPQDLTVFWGANPNAQYHGPIRGSWSGYELKLGGPGRNILAHKLSGQDLQERASLKSEFKNNVPYNVEIEKKNGKLTLKIDGQNVYEVPATGEELSPVGERKGFGLVFWHTAGWIGPIRIKGNG